MDVLGVVSSAGESVPAIPTEGGGSMWETITTGVTSFVSGVVKPVFDLCAENQICLAFLTVTFVSLGVRIVRRTIGAFGRGR